MEVALWIIRKKVILYCRFVVEVKACVDTNGLSMQEHKVLLIIFYKGY